MKRVVALAVVLSVSSGALLAAQLYRWVDEQGRVEWRDTPPPPHAKKIEQRRVGGNTIETSTLPYNVQQAVRNFPVTLWAFDCGAPCTQARAHLGRRGVPHTEKDPRSDLSGFEKLTGGTEVPVLFVGSNRIKGYLDSEWDSALDIAGYPRTVAAGFKPAPRPAPKPAQEPKPEPAEKPAAPSDGGATPQSPGDPGGKPAAK
jgi:hypothetical protein